jgi:hypothetical protein
MLHRFRAAVAGADGNIDKADGIGVLVRLGAGDARNGGDGACCEIAK